MSADEEQAVLQAVMGFYDALVVIFEGETGAMAEVWSHADDVTYMGPAGGYRDGWDQVLEDFRKQAELKLGGKGSEVTPEKIRISVGRDIAVVHNMEMGTTDVGGEVRRIALRATNLYRKENGAWKQIGHHADLLPPLAKAAEDED